MRKNIKAKDVGELQEKLVGIQRVTKVTKGGRDFSFSAIVVVGNKGRANASSCVFIRFSNTEVRLASSGVSAEMRFLTAAL